MSIGSTGPGGVQSSAPTTPIERPEATALDPSQISFADVLAQLFRSAPPDPAGPDFGAVSAPVEPPDRAPSREAGRPTDDPPTDPGTGPRKEAARARAEEAGRNLPPEESAADEKALPPDRPESTPRTEEPSTSPEQAAARPGPVASAVALPVVVEARPAELPDAPATPPAPPAELPDAPATPPAPPAEPTVAPPSAPVEPPMPPILRAAEGAIDAQALGAAPQPPGPEATTATAARVESVAGIEPDPAPPGLDVVSASSQVTAAGVAPAAQGAEAGLDPRTGQPGSGSAPAIAGKASQGTPPANMEQAASPRRVDPGPVIERVVRGLRLSMRSGQSHMRFLLTPPSLGSVTVDLDVRHGVLSAHIAADSVEARDLLARNLSALTDSLRDQGLHVGDVTVSARQDGERGNGAFGQAGGGLPAPSGGEAAVEDPRAYADERRLLSQNQMVDLMA